MTHVSGRYDQGDWGATWDRYLAREDDALAAARAQARGHGAHHDPAQAEWRAWPPPMAQFRDDGSGLRRLHAWFAQAGSRGGDLASSISDALMFKLLLGGWCVVGFLFG